jgi:hypothetical protein
MRVKRVAPSIGRKVLIAGAENDGFAEVASYPDAADHVEVSYFTGPSRAERRRVPVEALRIEHLATSDPLLLLQRQGVSGWARLG